MHPPNDFVPTASLKLGVNNHIKSAVVTGLLDMAALSFSLSPMSCSPLQPPAHHAAAQTQSSSTDILSGTFHSVCSIVTGVRPLILKKAIISVQKASLSCSPFLPSAERHKRPPDLHKPLALFISLINDSFVERRTSAGVADMKRISTQTSNRHCGGRAPRFKLGYSFMILSDAFR